VDVGETTVAIEFNDVDALERALATGEIAVVLAEPAMTDRTMAASSTVVVIGPAVSCEWLIGTIWVRDTRPTVGLNPTTPLTEAGQTMEPLVSVPIAAGARPMATAVALPADEPHGVRAGS
jgi:hypothetical protein